MLRRARLGAWIVGALLAPAAAAWAQEPAAPPAPAPAPAEAKKEPEPPPIVAVPAAEIVSSAEETKALLKQIEERAAPNTAETRIETELPELAAQLAERAALAETLLAGSLSLETLTDLEIQWRSRSDTLTGWRQSLTRRAVAIEQEVGALDELERRWLLTRDEAAAAGVPHATLQRAEETLAEVRAAEKRVKKRRSHVLTLQNKVAQQELVQSGVLERVAARRAEMRSRLFKADEPPLWSASAYVRDPGEGGGPLERIVTALHEKRYSLLEYLLTGQRELGTIAAVFALVWLSLSLLRPRLAEGAQEDPNLHAPARVFARPISSALLVSVFSGLYFSTSAPIVVRELGLLAILAPMLRILPRELYGGLRPGVFGLAAVFTIGTLRNVISGAPIIDRLLLLVETLAGMALYLWVLRPANAAHLAQVGRFAPLVRPVVRIALALLALAALANLGGFVSLARVTMRGALMSAYVAIAIYGLARIAGGAITAILRSETARRLHSVREHAPLLRRRMLLAVHWLAAAAWVVVTLRLFTLSDDVVRVLGAVLRAKLELGTASVGISDVLGFALTLWIAVSLSRFLRFVLDEDVLPRIALPRGVPNAIATGVHYVVLFAGFLLAIAAAGIDLSRFTLLAGALGVGIGFGMQNVVNNFVSGLILLFERPVQLGDSIDVGSNSGEVRRIGIRSSTIRTFEGAEVIVPNANLISETVVNWTLTDRQRRVDVRVGVEYGSEPEKVMALLVSTARAHAEVLSIPEPVALFTSFGASSLDFELRFWCRYEIAPRVKSEVNVAVLNALAGAGIGIPFPQQDLHLKVEGPLATALAAGRSGEEPDTEAPDTEDGAAGATHTDEHADTDAD